MPRPLISRLDLDAYTPTDALNSGIGFNQHQPDRDAARLELGSIASVKDARALIANLALDLVLKEILWQARLATHATAAAIGFSAKNGIVCRATAGATAPEVEATLNACWGMFSACVRTRHRQQCDDSAQDDRFSNLPRLPLGVRAVLMVPVPNGEEQPSAVIAIFSLSPHAFCDRDLVTLEALAQRVEANFDFAKSTLWANTPGPSPQAFVHALATNPRKMYFASWWHRVSGTKLIRDRQPYLMGIAIVLAFVLGWMVRQAADTRGAARAGVKPEATAARQLVNPMRPRLPSSPAPLDSAKADQGRITAVPIGSPPSSSTNLSGQPETRVPKPISSSKRENTIGRNSKPELVLYEDKNLSTQHQSQRLTSKGGEPFKFDTPAQGGSKETSPHPAQIPEETAEQYLLHRVEPQYPEIARERHIQGNVVLDVIVSQHGVVRGLSRITGDSQLVGAAAEAIRQWRFKPLVRNGRPIEFETRVTLNFLLP